MVRSGPQLEEALAALQELLERVSRAPGPAIAKYNLGWQEWLNVRSIPPVAELTCRSALVRQESRGSHYRSDYPERRDRDWLCNILVKRDGDGSPQIWTEEANLSRLRPD